jgi:DNA repair protein RecN (Recombination protein N)
LLIKLHISNYAIISNAEIHFNNKLNIITGETGAGKSILMGALGLILGDRADLKSLMNSNEKCIVEGTFDISNYTLEDYFLTNGLDYDLTCIMRREISSSGKSRAFINDTPVNLSQLKELGSQLIEIVSQHQTLELNDGDFQLSIIDAIAGTTDQFSKYKKLYFKYKSTEKDLLELIDKEKKSRQDEDYFRFQLNELLEANILIDEQAEIENKIDILSNAESIQYASGSACRLIDTEESSLIEQLRSILNILTPVAKHHSRINEIIDRLNSNIIDLKDISSELAAICENTQSDANELERLESRLQLLINLQKKHHVNSNEKLLLIKDKFKLDIEMIGSIQKEIEEKQLETSKQKIAMMEFSKLISDKRNKSIPIIEKNIIELLKQVQMPDAKIKVNNQLLSIENFTSDGIDRISLMFSANKGSLLMPINKVASGGELSRLMLCIKSLISDKVALPSIVFDEIDTGISGETALKVSRLMKQHANEHQVIAITHLPQIASKADSHFYVYKSSDKTTTKTFIKLLNAQEHIEEIARMLHGENPSPKVIEAAKELISD